MPDDYCQDSPDESYEHPVNKWIGRGSKGNRVAQAARWYARNKTRRRAYMRDYMRRRRGGAGVAPLALVDYYDWLGGV
jgi:hypothetical protein